MLGAVWLPSATAARHIFIPVCYVLSIYTCNLICLLFFFYKKGKGGAEGCGGERGI